MADTAASPSHVERKNRFIESSPAPVHGGAETPATTEAADASGEHFLNLSGVQSGCKQMGGVNSQKPPGRPAANCSKAE
jgi:hypothetical protein